MKNKERKDQTAEFFTPTYMVDGIINNIKHHLMNGDFGEGTYSVLDPACGNGQFIMSILNEKGKAYLIENGISDVEELTDNSLIDELKSEAVKETYGVDLMASNIMDLIARIVFWKTYGTNIFDGNGQPKKGLTFPGYVINDNVYWLKQHTEAGNQYSRSYTYKGNTVTIRNKSKKWWIMEYYIHNWSAKCYTGGGFCNNFVVADGLKYDYQFDGKEPMLETALECSARKTSENEQKIEAVRNDLLGL